MIKDHKILNWQQANNQMHQHTKYLKIGILKLGLKFNKTE